MEGEKTETNKSKDGKKKKRLNENRQRGKEIVVKK